ncbi:NADH:ubiquinone reductase (H(+)-translocating) [Handroanthus impetiginosus]|uniref:NADH-ubiquinone oxidoreductase chain 3 n=1 Tax=Handroanthus impetiginosus TaxID=429701 RepID=A0A2G9G4L4_9LAMI|nr:NADH:ubiquinone reductase (H(+)-translocating) [Handroanthus impetiginosus]
MRKNVFNTYKLVACPYYCRSCFDIRFYLVSILCIIPDMEVTFSFLWAVPSNKIDSFGSWSMMAFLLILTIGSLYEWKRDASDRE